MTGVAVCLVALYGLQSDAVGTTTTYEFKAVDVDEDAYLAANLARNGKLPVRISEVAKDASLVSTLKEKVESQIVGIQDNPATIDSCDALIKASNLADIFHHSFDYEQSPNYLKLLQAALDAGVQVFNEEYCNGLVARTAQLTDITEQDLKAPSSDGTATAAVSTILAACLTAMLTAVSA
ncbi:hypothetical protein EBH_0013350 [Eimeria brunetti]|uniref:SAG family member n=1 Tax=Eimeria brunetti TaxID=51314 RepID=U6LAN7_9EIME|nr:hypothetical protein EBH_0013350 [Eimeria brunetti]